MNAKHTPGPWDAELGMAGQRTHCGVYGQFPGLVTTTPAPILVARCQNEADARLIAAAPDMLAALKEILADNGEDVRVWPKRTIQMRCEAAIAKAEGVAP